MLNKILNFNEYTFTIYSLFPAINVLCSIAMAIIILLHENFSKTSKAFSVLLLFSVPIWFIGHIMMISSNSSEVALIWSKTQHFGVLSIPAVLLYFTLSARNIFEKYKKVFWSFICTSLLFLYFDLFTGRLIISIKKFFWGYYPQYDSFGLVIVFIYISMLSFNIYLFWNGYRSATSRMEKQRMKSFAISFLVASGALVDFIAVFGYNFYPFGYLPILIFNFLLAKTLWEYNLVYITPALASKEIIKTMNDLLIITDTHGFIQLMNPSAEKFFTVSERSAAGKHISKIINSPLFQSEKLSELVEKVNTLKDNELIYTTKTKEEKVLNLNITVLTDSANRPIGTIFTAKDQTDYKNAQKNIQKAYITTQSILQHMPVGIITLTLDKKIKTANKEALKMMELTSENEIIGQPYENHFIHDISKEKKANTPSEEVTSEKIMLNSSGKKIPLLTSDFKTVIDGKEVILESFIDITKSKELETKLEEYKDYLEGQVQIRTGKLQETNQQLLSEIGIRKKVADTLKEKVTALEKFREDTMQRETEMIDIKKTINQLSQELNMPPPYNLSFLKRQTHD